MKRFLLLLAIISLTVQSGMASENAIPVKENPQSLYDFTVKDIDGKIVPLKKYKGKVILLVNTASKCGFTKQYADLVKLATDYTEKGLVVLGFPANNFGQQEPGTNKEIKFFCQENYQVNFPMFAKSSVVGKDQAPLFKFLTTQKNPDFIGPIKWNFEKFLIGQKGELLRRFRSKDNPNGETIIKAIEKALEGYVKS